MFSLINILYLLIPVQAHATAKYCDLLSTDLKERCYLKETLVSIPHSPNQIAMDQLNNKLFFSFDFGQGEYLPAYVSIANKKITTLKGIKDAFAIAADHDSSEIYFGGSSGVYKYSPIVKSLWRLSFTIDVWWLFIQKDIYFIKFPNLIAYYYSNKTIKKVHSLRTSAIHQFVLDNHDNIYFINSSGLFGVKHGGNDVIMLREHSRFVGMAVDNKGQVYACSEDGIFVVTKIVTKVKKLIDLQGVLALTFDRDNNLVYSNSHDIIRLVPVSATNIYNNDTLSNDV